MSDCWVAHADITAQNDIHENKFTDVTQVNSVTVLSATTEERRVIEADATGGAFSITLPAVATMTGQILYIIKTDSSSNNVTLDGNGSETIDGELTQLLKKQNESVTLYSTGTVWYVL